MARKRTSEESADDARLEKLQAFGDALADTRKEAVDARQGIESEWQEDEEFYNSIDDVNRTEVTEKGPTLGSTLSTFRPAKSTKSNVFVNITQTYVDMAAASIADMLLPTDDMPFGVEPEPEPDLFEAKKDQSIFMTPGPDGQMVQKTAAEIATLMISEAKESAKKAETWIWDKLTGSQWHAEVRKLIDEAAKIGTSVLKGPVPVERKSKKIDRKPGTQEVALTMVSRIMPASKQISPTNFFPDPACGENIQDGSYTWERDSISTKVLRGLKTQTEPDGTPFYLNSQIDLVLEEGPTKVYPTTSKGKRDKAKSKENDQFEIWYFYGTANAEDMAAAGCICEPGAAIPVMVTMVNDRVIKATISTLDSGEFPYDVLVWQRVPGKWYGKGEARKIRACQRILNAAVRALMDNAGLSAKPQIVIDGDLIEPADGTGNMDITPGKVWRKIAGELLPGDGNIKNAITSINIISMQAELMAIVKMAIEFADRIATMPIQQQGQQGVTQETAEGRRLLQNNAGVVKRRMAKLFDDCITEPHVTRYYEWMLLYGEDPSMKRDLVIDAKASSALYERDAYNMEVAQLGSIVKDPAFGISPSKWVLEYFKSKKIDPKRFEKSEEEKQRDAQAPQPKAPQVEVAEINAEAKLKVAKVDTDRDAIYAKIQANRDANDHNATMSEIALRRELAMLDYANKHSLKLEDVKAMLAKTAMTLNMQEKLATTPPAGAPEVSKPAVEPRGRAPRGEAFQK